jgi:hypothetical protein
VAALLGIGAVVITHHVTSFALLGFLALWTLVAWALPASRRTSRVGGITLLLAVASMIWLVYVGTSTVGYLLPQFRDAVIELLRLMAGDREMRPLFQAAEGQVAPWAERVTGFSSVLLILPALPFGLLQIWRRYRGNAAALALAAGALIYPASLALRLTEVGAEISNRSSEFVFVALGFVLAAFAEAFVQQRLPALPPRTVFTSWATVVFAGGLIVGWPYWARLPGPYLPASDTRSIDAQSIAAATWARETLGPDKRMIADRTNRLLMGSFGQQRPVTSFSDKVRTSQVFLAPQIGPAERKILRRGRVDYAVVDRRLSEGLPLAQFYYERGEITKGRRHTQPPDRALLDKFDQLDGASRVFDSGAIVIYDLVEVAREP